MFLTAVGEQANLWLRFKRQHLRTRDATLVLIYGNTNFHSGPIR